MDNKEMEMKKLDTEELEPVAGGADTPAELAFYEYIDKYKEEHGPEYGEQIVGNRKTWVYKTEEDFEIGSKLQSKANRERYELDHIWKETDDE
jgi:hypothetical protein